MEIAVAIVVQAIYKDKMLGIEVLIKFDLMLSRNCFPVIQAFAK